MSELQTGNNLITQTINSNNIKQNDKTKQEIIKPELATSQIKNDSFEKSQKKIITPKEPNKAMKIFNGVLSTVLFLGIFFLPDLIMARFNKKSQGILDKYKKFKPVIGDVVDSQKQNILKNGNIKITLEKVKNNFKYNEIIIGNKQGNIIQRILIKKEEMPNGKYITRLVKSYKGNDLINTDKINKNEAKYLFKEYKTTKIAQKEYNISVKKQNEKAIISKLFTTNNGEPVLKIKENNNQKENIAFLYDHNRCIGTDSQIIDKKNNTNPYNILNIPEANIRNFKYNLTQDGEQYNSNFLDKLLKNF